MRRMRLLALPSFALCLAVLAAFGPIARGSAPQDVGRPPVPPWAKLAGDARNSGLGRACHAAGRVAWSLQMSAPARTSAVVGPDEAVYVACDDGAVYAVNSDTGDAFWRIELPARPIGAPAITGDGLIVVACLRALYARNPVDGSLQWKCATGAALHGSPGLGMDGMVLMGSAKPDLMAFDGRTGKRRWGTAESLRLVCSGAATAGKGVVFTDATRVYAVQSASGELLWSRFLNNRTPVTPALSADGAVFVLAGVPDRIGLQALTARGELRWSVDAERRFRSAVGPTVGPDKMLFVGMWDPGEGRVAAFDGFTGKLRWHRGLPDSLAAAPSVSADGPLLIATTDGTLTALAATSGEPQWTVRLGARCFCAPAIGARNRVCIGDQDGKLYGIE